MATFRFSLPSKHEPFQVADPALAVHLSVFLYSDLERACDGAVWFEVVDKLESASNHRPSEQDKELVKCAIAEAVGALLLAMNKATPKETIPVPIPAAKWQHRGPDIPAAYAVARSRVLREHLVHKSARLARLCRSVKLGTDKEVPAQFQLIRRTLSECIYDQHEESGLYYLAALHGLSLRECFEALAQSRRAKLQRNADRYGEAKTQTK